jgi:hypothetical protein
VDRGQSLVGSRQSLSLIYKGLQYWGPYLQNPNYEKFNSYDFGFWRYGPGVGKLTTADYRLPTSSSHEEIQGIDEVGAQFAPIYDCVQHAVLKQEFGALEAFGKLLADCLLDDPRSGKTD